MTRLRIGHLSTMYHSSFLLMGTGWLEKEGLEPEWKLFGGGPAIVRAFEKGEIDIGYIGLPPAMIGIDRCLQIRCIAGGHIEGTMMIAVAGFLTLEECSNDMRLFLKQFRGLTIACPPAGSIHDVIIRNCLKESGYDNDTSFLNCEWADLIPELMADGEVKVAVGTPSLAVVVKRYCKAKIVIPPEKLWPGNPSYGIVASRDMIENSPDVLQIFISLHEAACRLICDNKEEASRIVSETVGVIDVDFVKEMYEVSPKYSAGISEDYIASTMRFVGVMRESGYISGRLCQEDIFDLRFVKELQL